MYRIFYIISLVLFSLSLHSQSDADGGILADGDIFNSLAGRMKIKSIFFCYKYRNDTIRESERFYDVKGRIIRENYYYCRNRKPIRNKLIESKIIEYRENDFLEIDILWDSKPIFYDTNSYNNKPLKIDTVGNKVTVCYNDRRNCTEYILDSAKKVSKVAVKDGEIRSFFYNNKGKLSEMMTECPKGEGGTNFYYKIFLYDSKNQIVEFDNYFNSPKPENLVNITKIVYGENGLPYYLFDIYPSKGNFEIRNSRFILYKFWN